jgi:hypothetical protein
MFTNTDIYMTVYSEYYLTSYRYTGSWADETYGIEDTLEALDREHLRITKVLGIRELSDKTSVVETNQLDSIWGYSGIMSIIGEDGKFLEIDSVSYRKIRLLCNTRRSIMKQFFSELSCSSLKILNGMVTRIYMARYFKQLRDEVTEYVRNAASMLWDSYISFVRKIISTNRTLALQNRRFR